MIPGVGKYYNCFDDGKISHSRLYRVLIYKILTKEQILEDPIYKILWEANCEEHPELYDESCDIFIASISEETTIPRVEIFGRTKDGGWFGLGELVYDINGNPIPDCWNCSGRLDVDGSLTKQLEEK